MSAYLNIRVPVWLDFIFTCPLLVFRLLRYGYTFRKIYLGEGEYTIVEPADYYTYGKYKWILLGTGRNVYAVREMKIGPKRTKRMYLHREIMKPPKGKVVDHRNSGGLDNRRANLRLATHAENMQNRGKMRKKTTSRFIGVHLEKKSGIPIVEISHQGKLIYIGRFKNEIEAAKAYDKAAIKYHKEFARLNFPSEAKVPEK
jgi:hypothetical protein